jgi:hypothetical protein
MTVDMPVKLSPSGSLPKATDGAPGSNKPSLVGAPRLLVLAHSCEGSCLAEVLVMPSLDSLGFQCSQSVGSQQSECLLRLLSLELLMRQGLLRLPNKTSGGGKSTTSPVRIAAAAFSG